VHTANLYQLYAYMQNLSLRDQKPIEGLLLYAQSGMALDLEYDLHGHKVRVRTVDLSAPPERIREDVLRSCLDDTTASEAIRQLSGNDPISAWQAA
jgi:5-methylcytosine-specific restriction enzyme subunit McrC